MERLSPGNIAGTPLAIEFGASRVTSIAGNLSAVGLVAADSCAHIDLAIPMKRTMLIFRTAISPGELWPNWRL
jgi:hypothetical protein